MDRRDSQSSLPSSLIPYLYAGPRDSSTRTTLTSYSEVGDRERSSLLVLPPIPRDIRPSSSSQSSPASILLPSLASLSADIFSRDSSWREGEAGPSSLIHRGRRGYNSSRRRGTRQPARVISPPNTFIAPLQPLQHLGSIPPPFSIDRRDTFSYPQVGSLSIPDSNYLRQVSTPEREPSYGSEPVPVDIGRGSNEGGGARKNNLKRRRPRSMDIDDNPRKKTAVACNFCRGRKLRCDGHKPSCNNCDARKYECEYVSTQRRRGPGKAKKGSRSKKGRSEQSGSSSNIIGDRLPTMVPDCDASPDLRPYTNVLTLDTFDFQPPSSAPQYPLMRRQGPRSRTSRSRETSSDAKYIHRKQPGS